MGSTTEFQQSAAAIARQRAWMVALALGASGLAIAGGRLWPVPPPAPGIAAASAPAPVATAPAVVLPQLVAAIPTYTTRPESFDVRIGLSGEFRATHSIEVRNAVEGQTTVLTLLPEGTRVRAGDIVATLSTAAIEDRMEAARIRIQDATAAQVGAQEALTIEEMQNESNLKLAQTAADMAKLEYEQFDRGDARLQAEALQLAIANAQADLERKTKDLRAAEALAAKGFVPDNDLLDARTAERDARQKLSTGLRNLEVWTQVSEPRQRKTLQRKCDDAVAELLRVRRRNEAGMIIRQTDLRAREFALQVETQRFGTLLAQRDGCTIKAPGSGLVIYPSSGGEVPVGVGSTVQQNQVLCQLADTAQMGVAAFLSEPLTHRVGCGQEVLVSVDALPGRVLRGKVESVATFPDPARRRLSVKEYRTQIVLEESPAGVKPGMSARVEILADRLAGVIAVPQQAVFLEADGSYVYVGSADSFEKRPVKTGLASTRQVQILDGLKLGEPVLLAKPSPLPAATQTEVAGGPRLLSLAH